MKIIIILLISLALASCANLDGYRRSYTLSYVTQQGQPVGIGVTLDPVKRSGK